MVKLLLTSAVWIKPLAALVALAIAAAAFEPAVAATVSDDRAGAVPQLDPAEES